MKKYLQMYGLITALVGFEYWALAYRPSLSLLTYLQRAGYLSSNLIMNTTPGRPLSLWLGWSGLGLMICMNVYSLRKRIAFMARWGRLPDWLNFHIFCGLLGPTLIFFHCKLNVRGIVGISFWSMIVSLTSGIIGRYLYVQMNGKQVMFDMFSTNALDRLNKAFEKRSLVVESQEQERVLKSSLAFVGGLTHVENPNPMAALTSAFIGDIRMLFSEIPIPAGWPASAHRYLADYAINKRRSQMLEPFRKLMGYWHAFHFPFAIFMYVAAIIHIISSLIFLTPG